MAKQCCWPGVLHRPPRVHLRLAAVGRSVRHAFAFLDEMLAVDFFGKIDEIVIA